MSKGIVRFSLRAIGSLLILLTLNSCSSSYSNLNSHYEATPSLEKETYTSFDGRHFGYKKWEGHAGQDTVLISVHGISGATRDFDMLAEELQKKPLINSLYAYEVRGQGRDPVQPMRGDIKHRKQWYRDLYTFTTLVRKKHPKSRIIWVGESLGSLIVLNAYAAYAEQTPPCDGMILSSPIVTFRDDFPAWKKDLAQALSVVFPKMRLSLETLGGNDEVRVTKDTVHTKQAKTNDWHIPRHTLRLLNHIAIMIDDMASASQTLRVPVLILNGGNDVFIKKEDVDNFVKKLPAHKGNEHHHYAESFHLLFYDHQAKQVKKDTLKWIKTNFPPKP